ncbi:DUF4168 domain-containing protein [Cyanobacterium stanieri LEGE 03274]|uniref:DUF4168 domain-containing protein n=1 Tax=Cyanobacterium stanieri LEGE 03274 TaxID=1828756 RepID=A0ABR9V5E4_9CHRO|nr:DUF4168 domain-containing protein [Cyanobacterium stanieri]MBE9222736.1 DUF4168 domain-containing protein [Cyanobacterium stanieri LEGE 03274]
MINQVNHLSTIKLSSTKIILTLGLSTLGIVTGLTPEYNFQSNAITINNQAFAQNFSDAELTRYAQAAVEIERLRRSTFANIEAIVGEERSSQLACHQQNSINELPSNARSLMNDFCQNSEAIVRRNGLSMNQFNQITQQVRQNDALRSRLRDITRQL